MKKIKNNIITYIFLAVIFVIFNLIAEYIGNNPSKEDCVIGTDFSNCIEGNGSGHPLWNN